MPKNGLASFPVPLASVPVFFCCFGVLNFHELCMLVTVQDNEHRHNKMLGLRNNARSIFCDEGHTRKVLQPGSQLYPDIKIGQQYYIFYY